MHLLAARNLYGKVGGRVWTTVRIFLLPSFGKPVVPVQEEVSIVPVVNKCKSRRFYNVWLKLYCVMKISLASFMKSSETHGDPNRAHH